MPSTSKTEAEGPFAPVPLVRTPFARALLALVLLGLWLSPALLGASLLPLAEIDPGTHSAKAYHSYKHKLLLVALTAKQPKPCEEDLFFFYRYDQDQEDFFQLKARDLLILPDFSRAFYAKGFTMQAAERDGLKAEAARLKSFAQETKATAATLDEARRLPEGRKAQCWQQAASLNLNDWSDKGYPLLLASFCKDSHCPSFAPIGSAQVQLWAQMEPGRFQQILLELKSGKQDYLKSIKPFFRGHKPMEHAARKDLIGSTPQGEQKLFSNHRGKTSLVWETTKTGKLKLDLRKEGVEVKAARAWAEKVDALAKQKLYNQVLELAPFGLWLDPDNPSLRYQLLKVQAFREGLEPFFAGLERDYDFKERLELCRRFHLDEGLEELWKKPGFIERFKQTCPK